MQKPELIVVGRQAPDFTLRAQDNKMISLSEYAGKQNLIVFFMREFR